MKKLLAIVLAMMLVLGMAGCKSQETSSKNKEVSDVKNDAKLTYELSEDGESYVVTDVQEMNGPHLVIPDTYKNKPVTAVDSYILFDDPALETITIGKNVQSFDGTAISGCSNLKTIYFNATNCKDLEDAFLYNMQAFDIKVVVGKDVERIPANLFGTGSWSWAGLSVGELTFAEGSQCKEIGDNAFANVLSLHKLTLPEGLETIGEKAFYSNYKLTTVVLPHSLKTIEYDAFASCYKLLEVYNRSELNVVKGGAEHGRVAEKALAVHTDTEAPSLLVKQDDYLFTTIEGKSYLTAYIGDSVELILPESYNGGSYVIRQYAFYDSDIESVVIPANVKEIEAYAFGMCSNLKYATFEKTAGWKYYHYSSYSYDIDESKLKDTVKAADALSNSYSEHWFCE